MTRTLLPLTVIFALTRAAALGIAVSPIIPVTSAPSPADGNCLRSPTLRSPTQVRAPRQADSATREETCREVRAPAAARSKLFHHLRYHQAFPADRGAILGAMRQTAEVSGAELGWVGERLGPGRYASAAEVMRTVFPVAPAHVALALQR